MKKYFFSLLLLSSPGAFAQMAKPAVLREAAPATAEVSLEGLQRLDQLLQEVTGDGACQGY